MRRILILAALAAIAAGITQACSVLLPWDGYVDTADGTDGGARADADAALDDGAVDALAVDASPDGALTPFEVPCGSGLVCKNARACCAYGDGRPWECAGSCPTLDEAGSVIRCDSPTDCTPGEKCCAALGDGGTVDRTYCSIGCPGSDIRTCDPAFGGRDCASGSVCTRVLPTGFGLTFCEGPHDK